MGHLYIGAVNARWSLLPPVLEVRIDKQRQPSARLVSTDCQAKLLRRQVLTEYYSFSYATTFSSVELEFHASNRLGLRSERPGTNHSTGILENTVRIRTLSNHEHWQRLLLRVAVQKSLSINSQTPLFVRNRLMNVRHPQL